jgi:glyoxylase-like metal-dependent hydrolase (beta-lactamase superfamily II)
MDVTEQEQGPEPIVPGVARALSPLVRRILALNPGAATGLGTNTYLVGIDEIVVIDPGPDDPSHLDSVAGCGGDRIRWITTTRSGPDYDAGMAAMLERTGAERLDPADGETILGTEFRLNVHAMPGPTPDHRAFLLEEERLLICGGLMCDEGPAPLVPGVSDLGSLIDSVERAGKMRLRRMAPSHGYVIEDPKKAIPAELERRSAIDDTILKALKEGASELSEIVEATYPGESDEAMIEVLAGTVEVHLAKLVGDKRVKKSKSGYTAA